MIAIAPSESATTSPRSSKDAFLAHAAFVRTLVEPRLVEILDVQSARARNEGRAPAAVVDALREITLSGGKRLRPALLAAAYRSFGGPHDAELLARAGAALELFQTYLLIHDDWMDGDRTRRGRAAAHVALGDRFDDSRLGENLAVLAGNLACALARDCFASLPIDDASRRSLHDDLVELEIDLCHGQALDLFPESLSEGATEHVSSLKTGSYSVTFPLRLGAMLGGASADARERLTHLAVPVGIAFQLRDDWLGIFGREEGLGKPVGSDLKNGRANAVTGWIAKAPEGRRLLDEVERVRDGGPVELDAAIARTVAWARNEGIDRRVDARIVELAFEAHEDLDSSGLSHDARRLLHGAIEVLTERWS